MLAVLVIINGIELFRVDKDLEASRSAIVAFQNQPNEAVQVETQKPVQAQHQNQEVNPVPVTALAGDADNGKTISLVPGQKLSVQITEIGSDGGYEFQNPDYDTSLLRLDNQYIIPPPDMSSGVVGSSPTGVWAFTALKSGATDLVIVTARPWDKEVGFQYKISISVH